MIRRKLDVGDYGVEFEDGHVPPVYFERKSLTDLFGTLGEGYARFKKEINRAKDSKSIITIITEANLSRVYEGTERSFRSGDAIVSQLFTIKVRYGIETVFCNNRRECSEYITQHFLALGRAYIKNRKTTCLTKCPSEESQVAVLALSE